MWPKRNTVNRLSIFCFLENVSFQQRISSTCSCKRILIRNRVASSSKITSGERYIFFGPAGRYNYKFVSTFDKLLFLKYATKTYRYKLDRKN